MKSKDPLRTASPSPIDPRSWLDEHGDALYRFAFLRVRDRNVAEDLVQETLLAAIAGRDRFVGNSSVRTWLIGILRRKTIDHLRTTSRERTISDEQLASEFNPARFRTERLRKWKGDPAEILEQKEFWEIFYSCTDKLPARLAEAYYLREIGGLSTDEICNLLEITPTNLGLRIYRARAYLRRCLDEHWFKPTE